MVYSKIDRLEQSYELAGECIKALSAEIDTLRELKKDINAGQLFRLNSNLTNVRDFGVLRYSYVAEINKLKSLERKKLLAS